MNSSNMSIQKNVLNSGKKTTKRSVSETKKYVAAEQGWICGGVKNNYLLGSR